MIEDKIICKKSDLTSIADTVRSKLGVTDTYYVSELSDAIERIPTGTQLPTLTNPGTPADLLSGKELIDQDGNKVTGTIATVTQATPSITVNSSGLITASATQSAGYVSSGTKSATKQLTTKAAATITPGTANQTIPANTYLTGTQTIKGDANLIASNIKSGVSIFGVTGTASGGGSGESKLPQFVDGTVTEITAEDLQGVTKIRNYAFYNYNSLTSITIPNNATSIGDAAFYGCSRLTSVTIPNSVTRIGNQAFYNCRKLNSFTISNNVTFIGTSAFYHCDKLTSIIIPDSVTFLGVSAFYNCVGLTSVTIGNGITSIKSQVFLNCSKLTSIIIPDSVTSIDSSALQIGYTTNKATIRFMSRTPPSIQSNTFIATNLDRILVPAGTGETYKAATNWSVFADYIEEAAS